MSYKKYVCAFADSRMKEALNRFWRQADRMQYYNDIFLYDENTLEKNFKSYFADKLKPDVRGFGYWVWKPQIILKSLEKIHCGDILQYSDAGCYLNSKGINRLNEYFEITNNSKTGILAFNMESYTEKQWTKGDLFDYFGVRDRIGLYPGQIAATALFVKKCDKGIEIVKKWLKVFYDNFSLMDDTPSKSKNFEEFNENRHDQSVWSILCKLNDVKIVPYYEIQAGDEWIGKYPIYAMRDKGMGNEDIIMGLYDRINNLRIDNISLKYLYKIVIKKTLKTILGKQLLKKLKIIKSKKNGT